MPIQRALTILAGIYFVFSAHAGEYAAVPTVVTRAQVAPIGYAIYRGIPESRLRPFIPDEFWKKGLKLKPCIPGAKDGLDVMIYAGEEALPDVPLAPYHVAAIMTCADTPYRRADSANEADWFPLFAVGDSPKANEFFARYGFTNLFADFSWKQDDGSLEFEAASGGSLLIAGKLKQISPEPPGSRNPCAMLPANGRMANVTDSGVFALDWNKDEARCSAAGSFSLGGGFADIIGDSKPLITGIAPVQNAVYTFQLLERVGK